MSAWEDDGEGMGDNDASVVGEEIRGATCDFGAGAVVGVGVVGDLVGGTLCIRVGSPCSTIFSDTTTTDLPNLQEEGEEEEEREEEAECLGEEHAHPDREVRYRDATSAHFSDNNDNRSYGVEWRENSSNILIRT